MFRRVFLPLGSGGSQQSWWWCRAQHWPLSPRKTSAWGSCLTAPLPSSALSPGRRTCPHHTPDTWTHITVWPLSVLTNNSLKKKNLPVSGRPQKVTHVFQSDDVGMLPVSHQDFDLFRGIPLDFVDNLRHIETQMWADKVRMSRISNCLTFKQKQLSTASKMCSKIATTWPLLLKLCCPLLVCCQHKPSLTGLDN